MRSGTSKRWATSLALLAVLAACTGGKQLHGTREDLPGGNVLQMKLMTPTFGWVITDRRFVSTKDGGKTWNDLTPVDAPGNTIKGAFFAGDQQHVWCAALAGQTIEIYRSTTRGRAWTKVALTGSFPAVSTVLIAFDTDTTGRLEIKGEDGRTLDRYASSNAGATWGRATTSVPIDAPSVSPMTVPGFDLVSFVDTTHGWARKAVDKKLYATSDGGKTWTKLVP